MTPRVYQALVVAKALDFYDKTGIKLNTAYTPKAMMATAEKITGKTFKSKNYTGAAEALRHWAKEQP